MAHFSEIVIYARVDGNKIDDRGRAFEIPGISVVALPFYSGPVDYVMKYRRIRRFITAQVREPGDFYALWVPTLFSVAVARRVAQIRAPLLSIAIGDPRGVAESIFRGPMAKLLAWQSARAMRKTMLGSDAAVYVTLRALQKLYPTRPGVPTLARSNVLFPVPPVEGSGALGSEMFLRSNAGLGFDVENGVDVIAVGSQEQNYKGHDLLIDAVADLQGEGYSLSLTLIGFGALHERLIEQAARRNVSSIRFLKHVGDHVAVASELVSHDIFVIPSRTEGMPKALLEAMSLNVFSIGSDVGGIPEVLDSDCVFEAGAVGALIERLRFFLDNPHLVRPAIQRQNEAIQHFRDNHSGNKVLENFLGDWVQRNRLIGP